MLSKSIKVRTKPPYFIIIRPGLLEGIAKDLKEFFTFGKVAVITDSKVKKLYGEALLREFKKEGLRANLFSFPAGEASKNLDTVVALAKDLLAANFDRKDFVLALGGGVVGDVAGFLASIYLRGVPFGQVPTTLLAQVDASIGGKTGVDLPEGKNLLGTFNQPARVYVDPKVLRTLPEGEFKNGLAEVIKYACTLKPRLFHYLEIKHKSVLSLEEKALLRIIYDSCKAKADVVSTDEKESGLRRVLNFGHTFGHALEAYGEYRLPHGYCVALGLLVAIKVSEKLGLAKDGLFERVENLLKLYGLPTRLSDLGLTLSEADEAKLLSFLGRDKKVWKGKLSMVLLRDIGDFLFYEAPEVKTVVESIRRLS